MDRVDNIIAYLMVNILVWRCYHHSIIVWHVCQRRSFSERDVFQKCDGVLPAEFRSFAVDPQITSLEVLQHILIRAFDLSG